MNRSELIDSINKNYEAVREMKIENSQAFAASIRSSLEFAVKLFWQEKLGRIPVWVTFTGREEFILNEAMKDSRFINYFERWTITYMHLIRQDCNDIIHGQKKLTVDTAKELIVNLGKCIKAIEKVLGYSVITTIKKEVEQNQKTVEVEEVKEPRQKVNHSRFGEGEIISIKEDKIKIVFGGMHVKEFPYPESLKNGTLALIKIDGVITSVKPQPSSVPKSNIHRNTFFCFQNKQWKNEISSGYIFALSDGISHHERLRSVKEGDIIFHGSMQGILAVSTAEGKSFFEQRPKGHYGANDKKDAEGLKIKTKYQLLNYPIITSYYKKEIIAIQGDHKGKGYPFDKNGEGNQGYLFNLNKELAKFFMQEIIKRNPFMKDKDYVKDLLQ